MKDDFKGSLQYFKKAKAHYKKIGDKVSFAYTLWGEGTAFKMMNKLEDAKKDFLDAQKLFKETIDERGLAYCELSLGELEFLKGRLKDASKLFNEALKRAKRFSFGVEIKYAKRLLKALKTGKGFPFNLP
jgi:tetratricopeptide (TPR) repeat protein